MRAQNIALATFLTISLALAQAGAENKRLVKLHQTAWSIGGNPIMGTYGAEGLEYLQRVRDVGMNLVLAGEKELDPATPEGAFCLKNGIKVMPHVTGALYHGVKLREPVTADQKNIPLRLEHGLVQRDSNIIQIDDELIQYDQMTETTLINCQRGLNGTAPRAHNEGIILFWPEPFRAEIERIKSSPNLYGYYVLDDSPGDAKSALRAMYKVIREVDPNLDHPVCAGFGDAGAVVNLTPGMCDIMMIYWYPVSTNKYERERTAFEVQHMLATARSRVPGIPFMGIYQAFDGSSAQTGQGVPTPAQLREQLEDFVREGACGLVSYICHHDKIPGWADIAPLGDAVAAAAREIHDTGGLQLPVETEAMKRNRIQPQGHWDKPMPMPGYVPAWNVLAPFDATDGLDTPAPTNAPWRVRETTSGTLGLNQIYGVTKNTLAIAFCEVTAEEELPVQMRISTDDDARVSLNGKEIYRFDGIRGLGINTDAVDILLPRGTSRIDVKSLNRAGMWGFFMRFTDMEGKPAQRLSFSPKPKTE